MDLAKAEFLGLVDLLYPTIASANDEVARRILAILAYKYENQIGSISRRKLHAIKTAFDLPTRKRNTLDQLLRTEDEAVWSLIMDAPSPLGGYKPLRKILNGHEQGTSSKPCDEQAPIQRALFDE